MNLYPNQLRRIADLCEALDQLDYQAENSGKLVLKNNIPVHDMADSGEVYGHLIDEDGAGWSFQPIAKDE